MGHYGKYRQTRTTAMDLAVEAGLHRNQPRVLEGIFREPDPIHARLRVARAIVSDILDPNTEDLPNLQERLELARRLALEAQREVPAAWEPPMILGAATYLEWSGLEDERLVREYTAWETPLRRSLELAPAHREPTLFLATAYLELWPILSAEKQDQAAALVRRAMLDPSGLRILLKPWLDRTVNRQTAFAVIPPHPDAWRRVMNHYAEERRWNAYLEARQRHRGALEEAVGKSLAEAEARQRGGDPGGAREAFLRAADLAPAESAFDATLDGIFQQCPPGTTPSRYLEGLRRHLDRALDLHALGRDPLAPRTLARLRFAIDAGGRLPAPQVALATLAAGDLPRAEALARRAEGKLLTIEWAPYLLARARVLIQRGELTAAAQDLNQVHPAWTQRPLYWQISYLLAQAEQDAPRARLARARLQQGQEEGMDYPLEHWRPLQQGHRLEWFAAQPYHGLRLAFDAVPAGGAAVEIALDGDPLGSFSLRSGRHLTLTPPGNQPMAMDQIHFLEVRTLVGGEITPGRVRLLASPRDEAAGTADAAGARPGPPRTARPE
jgi:hypothetical protein